MRLFVGVPIADGLKKEILTLQEKIKGTKVNVVLVRLENLHFTLKFLGDIAAERVPEIVGGLTGVAARHRAFTVEVHDVGVFPSENFMCVVWVGIKEDDAFLRLAKDVLRVLQHIRNENHTKPVIHLTIARVQNQRNKERLLTLINAYHGHSFGTFKVDRFVLYKSVLRRSGPIYSEVASFSLSKK